jgi:hypothetical protein
MYRVLTFLRYYTNMRDGEAAEREVRVCAGRTCQLNESVQRLTYVTHLTQLRMPELFVRWWRLNFSHALFYKSHESQLRNFRLLIGIGWNCAETYSTFCDDLFKVSASVNTRCTRAGRRCADAGARTRQSRVVAAPTLARRWW